VTSPCLYHPGTVGENAIATNIKLAKARRADLFPDRTLSLEAACNAKRPQLASSPSPASSATGPADSSDRSLLIVTADLPTSATFPRAGGPSCTAQPVNLTGSPRVPRVEQAFSRISLKYNSSAASRGDGSQSGTWNYERSVGPRGYH